MIVALCCGGRDLNDQVFVDTKLGEFRAKYGDFAVVHGGARGADTLCGLWAKRLGLPVAVVEANWDFYQKRAGSLRNTWMLEIFPPNIVIAFPGGIGTHNMIWKSKAAGIPVWEVTR